jgi:FAD dependent oxidoreductase
VLDRQAKRLLGGAWDMWWLKTPLPGIVWCNCPHMTGYDALRVEDMTAAELEGRRRIASLIAFARAELPGFAHCYLIDVAPQLGVRQTRLLDGEYVVTKEDVLERRHFRDTVCRGRDYYTPYRALLPRNLDQLIVAGRHYSADPQAQKISREIPPCMVQGQAAGIAAALALGSGIRVRDVDPAAIRRAMRAQGADPGDVPSANATPARA